MDPSFRDGLRGPEYAQPVTVGSDVWVGGGAIIIGARWHLSRALNDVQACCKCTAFFFTEVIQYDKHVCTLRLHIA